MIHVALFFAVFFAAGAVYIGTNDSSAPFVVAFLAMFVIAYYALTQPDPPTED